MILFPFMLGILSDSFECKGFQQDGENARLSDQLF